MDFIPSKSNGHHLWRVCGVCVTYCGFHPAPSSPTPSVSHVTGDMKWRESNETRFEIVSCPDYFSPCGNAKNLVYNFCCSLVPRPGADPEVEEGGAETQI